MADVYSAQLLRAHAVSSGTVAVPPGFVWVVRTITVFYPAPAGGLSELVTIEANPVTIFWDSAGVSLAGQWRYWTYLNIVLPNDVDYTLSGSGAPDVTLSGYVLTLP